MDSNRPRLNIPTLTRVEEPTSEPYTNGSAAPEPMRQGDARGGNIATRTPWLDLPAPFDNLEIRTWLDYPKSIADLWTTPKDETPEDQSARVMLACQNTFIGHREACQHQTDSQTCREFHAPWADGEGALPETSDSEFWERIPTPLFRAIIDRFVEEMQDRPTSRISRRWKQKNSRRR